MASTKNLYIIKDADDGDFLYGDSFCVCVCVCVVEVVDDIELL